MAPADTQRLDEMDKLCAFCALTVGSAGVAERGSRRTSCCDVSHFLFSFEPAVVARGAATKCVSLAGASSADAVDVRRSRERSSSTYGLASGCVLFKERNRALSDTVPIWNWVVDYVFHTYCLRCKQYSNILLLVEGECTHDGTCGCWREGLTASKNRPVGVRFVLTVLANCFAAAPPCSPEELTSAWLRFYCNEWPFDSIRRDSRP